MSTIPGARWAAREGVALTFALLAATTAACSPALTDDAKDVSGVPAREGRAAERFTFTGELRAVRSDELRTPSMPSWPIQIKWMAPEGSEVAEGDPVLSFDNTAILSKLEEQRLAYSDVVTRSRSREAQIDADRAEKSFAAERARLELEKAEAEAAIPESMRARRDYDLKQLARDKARSTLAVARRNLEAFEAGARDELEVLAIEKAKARRALDRATESLEQLTLKATRAGVLVYGDHPWEGRKFQPGDDTWPRMTVLRIPDLDRMEVVAWVSDVDDGVVRPGQPVTCLLDTYPDLAITGRVRDVAALADARSRDNNVRAFQVLIDLDRSDAVRMRPGMSVRVELDRGAK
ncbi:MAG TPA: efflux RND transporter periplasmic adaptor subunit [Verrucomicrobiae bacterium]|nr:efflux RND transporter periplasmic adaptor subunit [Verrucomicrobiae bacterium]